MINHPLQAFIKHETYIERHIKQSHIRSKKKLSFHEFATRLNIDRQQFMTFSK